MIHMNGIGLIAVGAALGISASCVWASEPVANIQRIEGSALVNHNGQVVPARAGMKFYASDRLMVLDDSMTLVQFNNCCIVYVPEGRILNFVPEHAAYVKQGRTCEAFAAGIGANLLGSGAAVLGGTAALGGAGTTLAATAAGVTAVAVGGVVASGNTGDSGSGPSIPSNPGTGGGTISPIDPTIIGGGGDTIGIPQSPQ